MRRPTGVACLAATVTACAAACGFATPVALADDRGAGLYEPFTGSASTQAAQRYVKRLAARRRTARRWSVSSDELRAGVFVNEGRPEPAFATPNPGAATERAERQLNLDGPLSAGLGVAALALGLCAAGLPRWLRA